MLAPITVKRSILHADGVKLVHCRRPRPSMLVRPASLTPSQLPLRGFPRPPPPRHRRAPPTGPPRRPTGPVEATGPGARWAPAVLPATGRGQDPLPTVLLLPGTRPRRATGAFPAAMSRRQHLGIHMAATRPDTVSSPAQLEVRPLSRLFLCLDNSMNMWESSSSSDAALRSRLQTITTSKVKEDCLRPICSRLTTGLHRCKLVVHQKYGLCRRTRAGKFCAGPLCIPSTSSRHRAVPQLKLGEIVSLQRDKARRVWDRSQQPEQPCKLRASSKTLIMNILNPICLLESRLERVY